MITEDKVKDEYMLVLASRVSQLYQENLQLRAQISAWQKDAAEREAEDKDPSTLKEVIKQQTDRSHKQ